MAKNEGNADRIVRAIVAIVLAYISYAYLSGTWQIVLYIIAVILLITALTGFCGLYKLLGINTK
jgi:uncharacterized membrane protein